MNLNNYLNILIKGVIEDPKSLKQYLIRTQKISERDSFVLIDEFYSKLNLVIDDLKAKCNKRYLDRKNDLYIILNLKKANKENTIDIENEMNTDTLEKFPLNLMHLTEGGFRGFLNYSNIEYMERVVLEILNDKFNDEPMELQQEEKNELDEVEKELYNNIFIGNAIYLFESYFENKLMNSQSRTDFRFLFEQMKKDELIYDTVSLGQYIMFISKYGYLEKELKSIEMSAVKNIQRANDYKEYKTNLKVTLK